jgi:RNA polymerase sigma-70 factor (ECF subfamily)
MDYRNLRNGRGCAAVLFPEEALLSRIDELARLAAAARDGEPERLDDLLAESFGIVHSIARSRLGDTLAAEEAAADALARVARGLGGLSDAQSYVRWLATVAARSAADVAKRRAGAPEVMAEEPAAPGAGPPAALIAADRARRIRRCVRGLPPRLREPVLLHFVEGLSYRETASVLDVGLGTVARRITKALGALRKALGEEP